jgi:hypothetical protein
MLELLFGWLMSWITKWLIAFGLKKVKEAESDKAIDEKTEAEGKQLQDAKTAKEVEDAARNSLDF